jgi:hypothetical protein
MGTGAVVVGGTLLGAIGGGIVGGVLEAKEQAGGKEMTKKYELPDFGILMSEQFVERVAKELPEFPQMQLEQQPVKDASLLVPPYLILRVFNLRVDDSGFTAWVTAKMVDGNMAEMWLRAIFTSPRIIIERTHYLNMKPKVGVSITHAVCNCLFPE